MLKKTKLSSLRAQRGNLRRSPRTLCVLAMTIILLSIPVFAANREDASGILYGKDNAYILQAPSGWILDNHSGVSEGLHAVFYPKGSTWKSSDCVMYTRALAKDKTINEVIDADITEFKSKSATGQVSTQANLMTGDKKTALVRKFVNKENKYYELGAYIDESKTVSMIILSCMTNEEFKKSTSAFKETVGSYNFLADKVNIMDKK